MGVGIEVVNLNAWYGTNHTLQDINLNIPANHATADLDRSDVVVDVQIADAHGTGDAGDGIGFVHASEAANKSAFAATGGADQRCRMVGRDV